MFILNTAKKDENKFKVTTRTIKYSNVSIENQNFDLELDIMDTFIDNNNFIFTGSEEFKLSDYGEIDYVSDVNYEDEKLKVEYTLNYEIGTNNISIAIRLEDSKGNIEHDTLDGTIINSDEIENIDVLFNIDGDEILLSEITKDGNIKNDFFSFVKQAVSSVSKVVTTVVDKTADLIVVITESIFGSVTNIVKSVAARMINISLSRTPAPIEYVVALMNKSNNKKQTQPIDKNDVYINDQSVFKNWKFLFQNMEENGCGLIATYNVMKKLGKTKKLYDIVYDYEVNGGGVLFGLGGTSPIYMPLYFAKHNVKVGLAISKNQYIEKFNKLDVGDMGIVLYGDNGLFSRQHYIAIEKTSEGLLAYNHSKSKFDNFTELLKGKTFTVGYVFK